MMQFTLRSDALYGIRLISLTKIDKWSILVKEMRGIFWRIISANNQKKSAGPGPHIGPTMPWPGNFSDTLTPHLRTPTRIWLHNPRLISFGEKNSSIFFVFLLKFLQNRYFFKRFIEFHTDFDETFSEIRRIL